MRIVLLVLVPPILLFACALLLIWLPLPTPFPEALSNGRNLLAAVITGLLGLVYVVGLTIYLMGSVRQAGRAWEQVFVDRGFTTQSYLGVGRQYQGELAGRPVKADYVPARVFQPALLNIYISVNAEIELAAGVARPLLGCRDCTPVALAGRDWPFQMYAHDQALVQRWVDQAEVGAALEQVMGQQKQDGLRELYLQSGRLWLRAHPSSQVTPERVGAWLDALLNLADAAQIIK